MSKQRVRLFVRGKVQGVFFRQALKVMAIKNNLTGWVRNLEDGRVEALLDGDIDSVNTVVEWAHGGPANSRVDDVEITTVDGDRVTAKATYSQIHNKGKQQAQVHLRRVDGKWQVTPLPDSSESE